MFRLLVVVLLAGPVLGQEAYDRLLNEADRFYWGDNPGLGEDQRLDLAYAKLADAAQLDPRRWEAFWWRGLNRCKACLWARGKLQEEVARQRARGATEEQIALMQASLAHFIEQRLQEAYHNFRLMEQRMRQQGGINTNYLRFADAAMKFANREYLSAKGGEPGAIADFEELMRRGFRPDDCREHIAWCHLDMGYMAFEKDDYAEAQRHWDEALKLTRAPRLRQILYTNKAGAFELDNEFGLAEKVLREQIALEPYRPVHHKNMGLVLGYQNRLKEALHHYAQARELCVRAQAPYPLALLHGNAWLRAAIIHGKLLEEDGDMALSWRLFLEYRSLFGDDYNFCFWFADFAVSLGQYDLVVPFVERAKALQPSCPQPYQLMVGIAPRLPGAPEEVRQRIEQARTEFDEALANFNARGESAAVRRICSGLSDVGDLGTASAVRAAILDPDPLAGLDADHPPAWILEVAETRRPFQSWEPGQEEERGEPAPPAPEGVAPGAGPGGGLRRWAPWAAGAAALACAFAILLLRRQARPA